MKTSVFTAGFWRSLLDVLEMPYAKLRSFFQRNIFHSARNPDVVIISDDLEKQAKLSTNSYQRPGSVALFRLSVLGPLVCQKILARGELTTTIRNLAQLEYAIPGSRKRFIGAKTIEAWYYAWRLDGIKGLEPKFRTDRGKSKIAPNVQAAILKLKQEDSKRSIAKIVELLESDEQSPNKIPTRSSVHRFLQGHNLSHRARPTESHPDFLEKQFCDFERQKSSSLGENTIWSWMQNLILCQSDSDAIKNELGDTVSKVEIEQLLLHIKEGPLKARNRAITVLAYLKKIKPFEIAKFLAITTKQVAYTVNLFRNSRMIGLFGPSKERSKKYNDITCKDAVFAFLHSPPMQYGVNRTTWTLRTLSEELNKSGVPVGIGTISKIIKNAGFKFRKAKTVLTSTDPEYRVKLHEITNILSNLKPDEKFFSVDEYGPFSVKMQGGSSLVKANQLKVVPQYQKSKGVLIVTAALELCENQITHFYSNHKNTNEMIKLIETLISKYSGQSRIYFSWDAASWHASKKLYAWLDEINCEDFRLTNRTPLVTLAPLPACAQFLNVIESVFSGMSKAIIHNSDYQSVEECKSAIDRYFSERNAHFKSCPSRAGNKIWGKERVPCEFSESSNCKDPLYR